jgi:shikimate dehydrogenase
VTEFFGSLSNYPGNTGTYYYSKFFKKYKYQADYNAFGIKDLNSGIIDLVSKDYKGFSLSMPFKREIIDHLDVSDPLCQKYKSCNTVLIKNSALHNRLHTYSQSESN